MTIRTFCPWKRGFYEGQVLCKQNILQSVVRMRAPPSPYREHRSSGCSTTDILGRGGGWPAGQGYIRRGWVI